MNIFNVSMDKFAKLPLRERLLLVGVAAAILYFIVDIALLLPQQRKIADLMLLDKAHKTELVSVNHSLAEIEKDVSKSPDKLSRDRAVLEELQKQIADVEAFIGQADVTTSQVGALVRKLLDASPGLTLLSLKTLPVVQFYSPESKAGVSDKTPKETGEAPKTIYRHGVEVSIKGKYMELLSYMENLQKFPKLLFWSEAKLDVSVYPDAVLKLVIYSLSEQPSFPLR